MSEKAQREVHYASPEQMKSWTNVTLGTTAANALRLAAKGGSPGRAMMPGMVMFGYDPRTAATQTKKDKQYLKNARNYDAMEEPFSFKKISGSVKTSSKRRRATLLDADVEVQVSYMEKTSAPGPNQRAAERAMRNRPASLGGPGVFERIQNALTDVVDNLKVPVDDAGKPISRSWQAGLRRTALLPVKVVGIGGALIGLKEGSEAYFQNRNEKKLDERFENARTAAINALDVNNMARQQLESTDEATRDMLRTEFASLNRYAPDVAKDERLAAGFLQRIAQNQTQVRTPAEGISDVMAYTSLQSAIDRNQMDLASGAGTLLSGFL